MAQFPHASPAIREDRDRCAYLLAFLLAGSLAGALWARLDGAGDSSLTVAVCGPAWGCVTLRALLFPSLMVSAYLIGRSYLFYILFFMKGALAAFLLCLFCARDPALLSAVLPPLAVQVLLPLPVQLWCGSVWLEARQGNGLQLFLFAPLFLFALLCVLIQMVLL